MTKRKDIIGAKINRWTILKDVGNNKYGSCLLLCRCKCGNEKIVLKASILNGHSKSCGCLHSDKLSIDLTGRRFGRLLVLFKIKTKKRHNTFYWMCKCDCGVTKEIRGDVLSRKNGTKSCGCLCRERVSIAKLRHGQAVNITSEYKAWQQIKQRCYKKTCKSFPLYGGRGIYVCERWLNSFENFFKDMGSKPSPYHSLDRYPDNNGGYEPNNCRWATQIEQAHNVRTNVFIEFNGKSMIIEDWARLFKKEPSSIRYWERRGKTFEQIYNHFMGKEIFPRKIRTDFSRKTKKSIKMIEQVFGDNVLLQPIEEEKVSKGGIIIPDNVNNVKNVSSGTVIRTGDGSYDQQTGKFNPISVRAGDIVLYDSNCLIQKHEEWDNLYLISEKDIITIVI